LLPGVFTALRWVRKPQAVAAQKPPRTNPKSQPTSMRPTFLPRQVN
jgi:hypothetical protein